MREEWMKEVSHSRALGARWIFFFVAQDSGVVASFIVQNARAATSLQDASPQLLAGIASAAAGLAGAVCTSSACTPSHAAPQRSQAPAPKSASHVLAPEESVEYTRCPRLAPASPRQQRYQSHPHESPPTGATSWPLLAAHAARLFDATRQGAASAVLTRTGTCTISTVTSSKPTSEAV